MEKLKTCTKCLDEKPLSSFQSRPKLKDGVEGTCKTCVNEKQKEKRFLSGNSITKKYEKTLKGKLVRTYRNMLSRVKGILKNKSHLYEGLEIISKEEFYKWSINDPEYNKLFINWVASGYSIKYSPSIDRKDPKKGYILNNMRWLTHSENSGNTSQRK